MVSGEVREAHVARMRFYADKELHVTKRMLQIFQHLEHQAEVYIASIEGRKGAVIVKELKRLRLSTEDRRRLRERYGFSV